MDALRQQLEAWRAKAQTAPLRLLTLGSFRLWRNGKAVASTAWGRDKTVQLFEFLVTNRHRKGLHKEQILDRLWEDMDGKAGEQHFKVALHGIHKVLEPDRENRSEPRFVTRVGLAYQLNSADLWIDADALEAFIAIGHQALGNDDPLATDAYREAIALYQGIYLPDRIFEDWTSDERERIQVLTMGAFINLAEHLVADNPMESIRLCQQALRIDPTWEDAYRLQMQAYAHNGNRPMAIKTYQQCERVLDEEFGITPLPETRKLLTQILSA